MNGQHEEWREIPGIEGYEASSEGRIRSTPRRVVKTMRGTTYVSVMAGRVLKPWLASGGYHYVTLGACGPKTGVHRLVCAAFHGLSDLEAAHRNGNRTDNRAENLRWATHSENEQDKRLTGTYFNRYRGGRRPAAGAAHA